MTMARNFGFADERLAAASLTHGWLPMAVQAITFVVLLLAIGWRSRRWRLLWLPVALLVGVSLAASVSWYVRYQGLADDPAPSAMWVWIALTGFALAVLVFGWRGSRWWRRGASVLAISLCVLSAALSLNTWVGYVPTVHSALNRLTGTRPRDTIVAVDIPATASGFQHRTELVYLPPQWHAASPPPRLPVVMMIGGEFGYPGDWLDAGGAQQIIDDFAAENGGDAPVLVFVDAEGEFRNDTECVNGSRGNAADHLTKDVVPYIVNNFGVSPDPANWGIVGWSSGGTCALTLSVMHPELFSAFVDIDGELGPTAGNKQQTIARLFGGDADAWSAFDPRTVITRHGFYQGMSAWFAVTGDTPTVYRPAHDTNAVPAAEPDQNPSPSNHAEVANSLCSVASSYGIECAAVGHSGKHDFSSAAYAFAQALPWLAGRIDTPGVPKTSLPGAPKT